MRTRPTGRLSLRLDAAYCAVAALLLLLFAQPVSRSLQVRPEVTAVAAAGVGGWALLLHLVAGGPRLGRWLGVVLVANVLAAGLIAAVTVARPWQGAVTVLGAAVAVEVALFAISQAAALRRRSRVRL